MSRNTIIVWKSFDSASRLTIISIPALYQKSLKLSHTMEELLGDSLLFSLNIFRRTLEYRHYIGCLSNLSIFTFRVML
jgi:hypothetical protein